jgi:hypothetical protein
VAVAFERGGTSVDERLGAEANAIGEAEGATGDVGDAGDGESGRDGAGGGEALSTVEAERVLAVRQGKERRRQERTRPIRAARHNRKSKPSKGLTRSHLDERPTAMLSHDLLLCEVSHPSQDRLGCEALLRILADEPGLSLPKPTGKNNISSLPLKLG